MLLPRGGSLFASTVCYYTGVWLLNTSKQGIFYYLIIEMVVIKFSAVEAAHPLSTLLKNAASQVGIGKFLQKAEFLIELCRNHL